MQAAKLLHGLLSRGLVPIDGGPFPVITERLLVNNVGDELVGVIDIQNAKKNSLGQTDVIVIEVVAGQMAVALRNARVLAETRQQAREEAILNEIGNKIEQAKDVESLLNTVAVELDNMLGVRTNIRLGQRHHEN